MKNQALPQSNLYGYFRRTNRPMLKRIYQVIWGFLIVWCSSCATISYTPAVSLDISPRTIRKTVQIDKFTDSTSQRDRKNGFGKFAVTNDKSLIGGLDLEVTKAITYDFSTNAVFKEAGRRVENPDFYLRGTIRRYKGITSMNQYTKTSYILFCSGLLIGPIAPVFYLGLIPYATILCGVPANKTQSEVEIEIQLLDNHKVVVSRYTAKAENHFSSSAYRNTTTQLPNFTNKVLTEVVAKLRAQLLAEADKLEAIHSEN